MFRNLDFDQRDLWLARLYYLSFMGGWGFIFPFINLFYVSLGLSGTQIGTIASTSSIIGLVAAPLWASRFKQAAHPRRFLQVALVLSAAGYLLISQQVAYLPILFAVTLQASAGAGVLPMSDSMAVTVAQRANTGYGSIRLWGSLGWIGCVLLAGQLIEHFGFPAGFTGIAVAFGVGMVLLFLVRPVQFSSHPPEASSEPRQPQTGLRVAVARVWRDHTLLGFAAALVLIGFLNSGVLQFENVFLAELGASKSLISFAGILSALVELPFMLFADRIMRRYGAHRLMLIALLVNIFMRLTVLSLPSIYTIMAVRFVGGTSFSLYTVSFVGLISERTSASERSTVLALFTVTIASLVNIVASPLAGIAFDTLGARWLYAFAAAGYLLSALVLWLTRPRQAAEA